MFLRDRGFATVGDERAEMMADRPEERILRGQAAFALELTEEIAHRLDALAVPRLRHLAVRALLLEHGHDVLAVDDFGMMIHAENARHAVGRAREFDHRHAVARFGFARDDRGRGALGDQIEKAIVDDAEVAAVGEAICEFAEPRMRRGFVREDVLRHAAALFCAPFGTRGAGPAAHQAETVADTEKRRGRMRGDVVEEPEQRRFPRRIFGDALTLFANAVVLARIEMTGTAGTDVHPEAAVR